MPSGDSRDREKTCRLLKFLLAAAGVIFFYWLVFQPHHVRATVDSATLTDLTVSNAAVSFHLAVGLSLYNPSLNVGIYYDALDSELSFRGASLGHANSTSPGEFYQHRKRSVAVMLEFDGSAVGVPGDVAGELEKEKVAGAVNLEVEVDAQVRYKFATTKIRQKPRIWCLLTIPVKPEGNGIGVGGAIASGDRCSVKY